jgi:transposase InsO family protein
VNPHKNARTTPHIRELIVTRRQDGWTVAEIAEAIGVSERTVYKWLARFRKAGRAGLSNGQSAAGRIANRLPDPLIEKIAALRRARLTGRAIAERLKLKRSTVAGWLRRLGMGRLSRLEPKPPAVRYERAKAGELVHIDTKKLGRFSRVGHRISGDRTSRNRGAGWEFAHVAIDDATRLAYVEMLPDETKESATGFLERACAWFAAKRIKVERVMTDNGGCYKSRPFAAALEKRRIRHIRTRPYTPRTNGKAERFIQTLLREWAYVRPYASSARRNAALPAFIDRYNHRRPHASLAGQAPAQALSMKR